MGFPELTVYFIKASKGESLRQDGSHDAMHYGSDIPSPLPSSIDEKQEGKHTRVWTRGGRDPGHQSKSLSQYANFVFAARAYAM